MLPTNEAPIEWDDFPDAWEDRCSGDGQVKYRDKDGNNRYADTGELVENTPIRPCARCGRYPNKDGEDACLGHLGKVVNACCGHGKHEGYIMFEDGRTLRGFFRLYDKNNNLVR